MLIVCNWVLVLIPKSTSLCYTCYSVTVAKQILQKSKKSSIFIYI